MCWCDSCLTLEAIAASEQAFRDKEEVLFATGDKDLIKFLVDPNAFAQHLQQCSKKLVPHEYTRHIQGKAISESKQFPDRGCVFLHFHFTENRAVVLPGEAQLYRWRKTLLSMFKCVLTTKKETSSCAVISDDASHGCAKASEWLERVPSLCAHVTYVSDGTPSQFRNTYQGCYHCRWQNKVCPAASRHRQWASVSGQS